MAQTIPCINNDGEHAEPAVLLVTNLLDGDTMGLCGMCAPPTLRATADAMDAAVAAINAGDTPDGAPAETVEGNGSGRPEPDATAESPPAGSDGEPASVPA